MSWMLAFGATAPVGTFRSVQFEPLSVERQTAPFQVVVARAHCEVPLERNPIVVDAQRVVVVVEPAVTGSIRIFEIEVVSKGPPGAAPSWVHVAPPSGERRIPRP